MSEIAGHVDGLTRRQCLLEVRDGLEAGAGTVITAAVVQPAECSFDVTHPIGAIESGWRLEKGGTSAEQMYTRRSLMVTGS